MNFPMQPHLPLTHLIPPPLRTVSIVTFLSFITARAKDFAFTERFMDAYNIEGINSLPANLSSTELEKEVYATF